MACDNSGQQKWMMDNEGKISSLSKPGMCVSPFNSDADALFVLSPCISAATAFNIPSGKLFFSLYVDVNINKNSCYFF